MAHQFSAPAWSANTNIYEVNVRQYTAEGTLQAFAKHLPRLQKMGVEVLWFMPLNPISEVKRQGTHGSYYACSDYNAINPQFGTSDDFKQLVIQAHELGMKVLVDIVANHTGYDHVWTKTHPSFYKKNEAGEFYDSHGWVDVIDLDYENKELWTAMTAVMQHWVNEYDVDGFRCDMAHLVPLKFWAHARKKTGELKELFWLAETEEPEYHKVFDASYTWKFLHLMEEIYKNHRPVEDVVQVLEEYKQDFPEDAKRLFFITNHDENSHSGSEYERLGNAVRAFFILCATASNSIPLIYSGQEIPNRKRLQFFEKDAIDWSLQCLMEDFYATLLKLRKTNTALAADPANNFKWIDTTNKNEQVLAYVRNNKSDAVLVMLNLSGKSMLKFTLEDFVETGHYKSIWSGLEIEINNSTEFELQAWEFLVYEKVKKN